MQPGRSRRVRCHVGLRNAPFREHAQAESSPFIQPQSSPTKTYHLNPSTTVSTVAIAPAPRKPHRNSAEAFERPRFLAANRSTTVSIGALPDGSGGLVWRLGWDGESFGLSGPFSLTLALSRWEREALRCPLVLPCVSGRSDAVERPPLPAGEGWGEGENSLSERPWFLAVNRSTTVGIGASLDANLCC